MRHSLKLINVTGILRLFIKSVYKLIFVTTGRLLGD